MRHSRGVIASSALNAPAGLHSTELQSLKTTCITQMHKRNLNERRSGVGYVQVTSASGFPGTVSFPIFRTNQKYKIHLSFIHLKLEIYSTFKWTNFGEAYTRVDA